MNKTLGNLTMRRNIFVTIGDLAARHSFLAIFAQLIDWGSQKYTKSCTALVEKEGCCPLPTKYIHIKSSTVYVPMSSRWNWDSPTPSLVSECAPPPGTKGWGGAH